MALLIIQGDSLQHRLTYIKGGIVMSYLDLISFLNSDNIDKEWKEWNVEMPRSFAIFIDSKDDNGEMIGWEYSKLTKKLHERRYFFDEYLNRELKKNIGTFITYINQQKYNPETLLSDKDFNDFILRHKTQLNSNLAKLRAFKTGIPETIENLNIFTNSLSNQIIKSSNSKVRNFTKVSENAEKLLFDLFDWLVLKSKVDPDAKEDFLQFFTSKGLHTRIIRWYGKTQELIELKYALFNPIDGEKPILSAKISHEQMFDFFDVRINNERAKYVNRRDVNNTRNGALYKAIIRKIDSLT